MRKGLLFCILAIILMGCAAPSTLYYWGNTDVNGLSEYDKNLYEAYKHESPKSLCNLICTYDKMVCNPGGTTQLPPPGICAEYGYLLYQDEIMTTFDQNATEKQKKQIHNSPYGSDYKQGAIQLFQKEMEIYPVSVQFLRSFVENFTGQKIDIPALERKEVTND